MPNSPITSDSFSSQYWGTKAKYRKPLLKCYEGNPFIEALPPIYSETEIDQLLRYDSGYDESERHLASELRLHLIANAVRFIHPFTNYYELEQRISRMIRAGYVDRNYFLQPGFHLKNRQKINSLQLGVTAPLPNAAARGLSIIGISGMGKSTLINNIFSLYDQVINHSRYHGKPFTFRQIVWMKLECPQGGLLSGLCKSFFKEVDRLLGTNTYERFVRSGRRRVEDMLLDMAALATRHCIGTLIIDEIQNLRDAKGANAAELLDFLVRLDNELGLPIVLVGTPKALPVLTGEFRRARRAAGQGDFPWDRMQEDDEEWEIFTNALWKYQYVKTPCTLTKELRHCLYHESQGITDLAVKAYMLAQIEGITSGKEVIDKEELALVAQNGLCFVQPYLKALRTDNLEAIKEHDDIKPVDLETAIQQAKKKLREQRNKGTTQSPANNVATVEEEQKSSPTPQEDQSTTSSETSQQNQTPKKSSKKKGDLTESKIELIQIAVNGEHNGTTAYDALKASGYTYAMMKYLPEDSNLSEHTLT